MNKVKKVIESCIEKTEPQDKILSWLKENDGKPVTVTLVKKLSEAVGVPVSIRKQYGMTSLVWEGAEIGIYLAHSEKNVSVDAAHVEKSNIRLFGALRNRNENRRKALKNVKLMSKLETALEAYGSIRKEIAGLLKEECFSSDWAKLQREFGIGTNKNDGDTIYPSDR